MSSTSRNPAYHPIAQATADSPSPLSSKTSSVININGNPIEAAFEAHTRIQRRGEKFEAELGDRINQLFPRCQPSTTSSQPKGSKSKKDLNTNTSKKRSGTGKKKSGSNKQLKTKEGIAENELNSSPQVGIVDNIIDLEEGASNCDDVNRRNFLQHQQMISNNRQSSKTMLSPTTLKNVNTFVPNDNIPRNVNKNLQRNSKQTTSEEILQSNNTTELSQHIRLEQREQQQDQQTLSTSNTNNTYIDSYLDNNASDARSNQIKTSHYPVTSSPHFNIADSPPHLTSLDATNPTNFSILNQLHSAESSIASGSNRSCQGTYSSMSGSTGNSISHFDSVSDNSPSFPPSAGPTATPSSVTSYSYSSSAMMMSPGSSTASSSEHSASGGNGGVRGVTVSNSNSKYNSSVVASGTTPVFHGENSTPKDQQPDQIITAVNAGRIRKNLSEYSVSGVDNRISAASTFANITQNNADTLILKDTKIEIAGGREVYSQSKVRSNRYKHGKQQPQQRYSADLSSQLNLLDGNDIPIRLPSEEISLHNAASPRNTEASKYHTKHILQVESNEEQIVPKTPGYLYENAELSNYNIQKNDNEIKRKKNYKHSINDGTYGVCKEEVQTILEHSGSLTDIGKSNISSATVVPSGQVFVASYDHCSKMKVCDSSNKTNVSNTCNIENASVGKTDSKQSGDVLSDINESTIHDDNAVYSETSSIPLQRQVIRETVFASEIHSIEYDSSLAAKSDALTINDVLVNQSQVVKINKDVAGESNILISSNNSNIHLAMEDNAAIPMDRVSNPKTTSNAPFPRHEEMVVFDDIGDMNLHYLTTNSSFNSVEMGDTNMRQFGEEPRNSCDVNVTYDLIQGTLPPPSISGLMVRPQEDIVTNDSMQVLDMPTIEGSIDNLYLGEEASVSMPTKPRDPSDTISSPLNNAMPKDSVVDPKNNNLANQCKPIYVMNGGKKSAGFVEIAQYEGSPRRYRPRISAEMISNASASSGDDRPLETSQQLMDQCQTNLLLHCPLKQNVPNIETFESLPRGEIHNNTVDELLRFEDVDVLPQPTNNDDNGTAMMMQKEDVLRNQHTKMNVNDSLGSNVSNTIPTATSSTSLSKSDFDFRYEFSETRKVLDEFFHKAENEFPAHSNTNQAGIQDSEAQLRNVVGDTRNYATREVVAIDEGSTSEFNDLNYTLRRFSPNTLLGSTAVGQRLAGNEEELINNAMMTNTFPNNLNKSSNVNNVVNAADFCALSNPPSSLVDPRNDASLFQNNTINRFEISKQAHNEADQNISADLNQTPSNTYQIQQTRPNIQPTDSIVQSTSIIHMLPSSTDLPSSQSSIGPPGFPLAEHSTHISTSSNAMALTSHQATNHIKTNIDVDNIPVEHIKDTQNNTWDNSNAAKTRSQKDPFVISTDSSHYSTAVEQDFKREELSHIGESITNSALQQPRSTTALVGNMRLNVAPHYSHASTLEHQHALSRRTDFTGLGFDDDVCRDNVDLGNTNGKKCNNQAGPSSKEAIPSSTLAMPQYFSDNKNVGTISSNMSNVTFYSGAIGSEKDNNAVHNSGSLISNTLLASGTTIDSRNFTLSPETTDCDSAELESEVSINEGSYHSSGPKFHTAMPILEDGLSSGHASDLEDDVIYSSSGSVMLKKQQQLQQQSHQQQQHHHQGPSNIQQHQLKKESQSSNHHQQQTYIQQTEYHHQQPKQHQAEALSSHSRKSSLNTCNNSSASFASAMISSQNGSTVPATNVSGNNCHQNNGNLVMASTNSQPSSIMSQPSIQPGKRAAPNRLDPTMGSTSNMVVEPIHIGVTPTDVKILPSTDMNSSVSSLNTTTATGHSHTMVSSDSSSFTATSAPNFQIQQNIEFASSHPDTNQLENSANLHLQIDTGKVSSNIQAQSQPASASDQHQPPSTIAAAADESVAAALKDIKMAIQATRVLQHQSTRIPHTGVSPTSTMGSSAINRRHPTIGSVIMNGSTVPISQVPNIIEGSSNLVSNAVVNNSSQMNKNVSNNSGNLPASEHMALDPWVPRSNAAPKLHQVSSLGTNNEVQEAIATNNTLVAGPNDKSVQSCTTAPALPNTMNTSQAVQSVAQPVLQKGPPSVPRTSTSNSNVVSSAIPSQQPAIATSLKEAGKPHTVLIPENMGNEKGAGRRDLIHSQDANIDDEVEDIDEDEEEDEDDDDELEDEESESEVGEERVPTPKNLKDPAEDDLDTDQETDRLLGQQYNDDNGYYDSKNEAAKKKGSKTKEVLIEGVLFRARYLGSTQLVCEGQPTKATRMMQAEEAVSRIKAPEGESQPSTEVDLFISTEKIMVLNTDLKEIMMDHALRSISYIADIGDLLVIMARRRLVPPGSTAPSAAAGNSSDTATNASGATTTATAAAGSSTSSSVIPTSSASALSAACDDVQVIGTTPKMICHVFESEEAQFIAQSIGQAFQVAYMEFLKANGIEDHSFVKEMDYQEVLNSQEIFGDELAMFARKELQKEVVVPKAKGEILGVVIVESGWGSMLPTIVLANLSPTGPAARCGQLNIGDQVIAINGISLVGLPLSTCQNYVKNTKNKTAVKLTAVSCAPVVEVKIKRPDTKYQLGFSVQNGVICSLLRGGIAERGGVRVGHRIIEINGQSVVAVPHERIVNLLATSVGEITMRTMPTSMFRLLTGQETPMYI